MTNLLVSFLSLFGVAMSEPNSDSIVSRHGDIALASQPSEADLDAWAAAGTVLVVNSRTPEETAALHFDMRTAVESRGMRYAELPIGASLRRLSDQPGPGHLDPVRHHELAGRARYGHGPRHDTGADRPLALPNAAASGARNPI